MHASIVCLRSSQVWECMSESMRGLEEEVTDAGMHTEPIGTVEKTLPRPSVVWKKRISFTGDRVK